MGLTWLLVCAGACTDAIVWSHGRGTTKATWDTSRPGYRSWLHHTLNRNVSGDVHSLGDGSSTDYGDGSGGSVGYGDFLGLMGGRNEGYGGGYGYGHGYGYGESIGSGYGDEYGDGSGRGVLSDTYKDIVFIQHGDTKITSNVKEGALKHLKEIAIQEGITL